VLTSKAQVHPVRAATSGPGPAGWDRPAGHEPQMVADFARAEWRKSSWSSFNGNCVEVACVPGELVGVRDTKDGGAGPVLVFPGDAWRSFLGRVKAGDLA
jgi:Domain of unknown function (DUF397)